MTSQVWQQSVLITLQAFQVLFLALHDWIPLGRLNDVRAVRATISGAKLFLATIVSTLPFAVGLAVSLWYFGRAWPPWLWYWLWISYAILFAGELRAWWIPYLFVAEPARAEK